MLALNGEIGEDQTNLGPGFCIGHSFFSAPTSDEVANDDWYQRIVDTEIGPLLEEYWFDNPARAVAWRERLKAE